MRVAIAPAGRAVVRAHHYSNGLKKQRAWEGRRLCEEKLHVPSAHLPVLRFAFSFFFYALQCQASQCTTQLPRWFMGNKGSCWRGLLHIGSIKSWAEQWFNSHTAIATAGGERESPLDCGHSVLLYHSWFSFKAFICRVAPKSWPQGATRMDKAHISLIRFSL